eukprot:CAMPEP_0174853572 /NCGR_PEP_ID=MMETSP1114-20130205/28995_1 /TAXON_ID=312471 /ORGANISM="Neobodo designis, Strain CCAP 1951/1" /LENGTH=198 /DNA_ID=CAMNT_0016088227 /DNA_START=119 /DNA_END=715 /DNA_ORIENTATION=+
MAMPKEQQAEEYMRFEEVDRFKKLMEEKRLNDEKMDAESIRRFGKKGKTAAERGELKPMAEPTWRSTVPVLRDFEYWTQQAARYPYNEKSDEHNEFFLRGVTVHPRLSDYPMCKDIISDYFTCRDQHPLLHLFNICMPLKEQMSSCINLVFVKNHKRAGRKLNNELREDYDEKKRERRLRAIADKAQQVADRRERFAD